MLFRCPAPLIIKFMQRNCNSAEETKGRCEWRITREREALLKMLNKHEGAVKFFAPRTVWPPHTRISANDAQFANSVIPLRLLRFLNKLRYISSPILIKTYRYKLHHFFDRLFPTCVQLVIGFSRSRAEILISSYATLNYFTFGILKGCKIKYFIKLVLWKNDLSDKSDLSCLFLLIFLQRRTKNRFTFSHSWLHKNSFETYLSVGATKRISLYDTFRLMRRTIFIKDILQLWRVLRCII